MDVFVIPVARDRYELYCEPSGEAEGTTEGAQPPTGLFGRLRQRFSIMLRAAEERHRRDAVPEARSWLGGIQDRILGWVAQRIAEQRLLWNLRRQTAAVAVHPPDLTFDQVMTLIRRILQRDYERHRVWLVIDTLGLIVSGLLALVPGPNVVAYYFAFRVVGHWLSMRGAVQGLNRVSWSGRPCPPLTELRDAVLMESEARDARVHDIALRLRLPHLTTFVERVVVPHA
jgi:K+-H+ exchange-related protein